MLPWPEMITTCDVDLPLAHARQRGEAVHARQPDVEHDDVVGLPAEPLETGLAAVDGVHLVALVAQHAAKRAAHAGFVVNDQDRMASTDQHGSSMAKRVPCGDVVGHVDAAAVLGDDAADDGQAETAAPLLGRVVRQEQLVALRRRNARTVVGHDDAHEVVRPDRAAVSMSIVPRRSIASMALSTG